MKRLLRRIVVRLPVVGRIVSERDLRRADREFNRELAAASSRGDHVEYNRLRENRDFEIRMSSDEDEIKFTEALVRTANRLRVPLPIRPPWGEPDAENEYWTYSDIFRVRFLTPLGVAALRDAIRREREARRAERSHWIAWIGAMTGLVGALTGLAAVLWK